MDLMSLIKILTQIKAVTDFEYDALYNMIVFIGIIIVILVMVYVLIGQEPEEEE